MSGSGFVELWTRRWTSRQKRSAMTSKDCVKVAVRVRPFNKVRLPGGGPQVFSGGGALRVEVVLFPGF